MSEIVFKFDSEETEGRFVAWLLDGGGEDSLGTYCEVRNETYIGIKNVDNNKTMLVSDSGESYDS